LKLLGWREAADRPCAVVIEPRELRLTSGDRKWDPEIPDGLIEMPGFGRRWAPTSLRGTPLVRVTPHLIASGLTGEPTAPVIGIAGATNMNSYTPSALQSAASSATWKISPMVIPMIGMVIQCQG
jgi:hypothetical protein